MNYTIIIATGNEELDNLIKEDLEHAKVGVIVSTVNTRNMLVKRFIETQANMLFLGDELIGELGTDEEWEQIIEDLRRISLQLRIVFFCDRSEQDIFLTKLTTHSVFDIFNEGSLPNSYLEQLAIPPAYKNIEKFRGKVNQIAQQISEMSTEQKAEEIISQGINIKQEEPKKVRIVKEVVEKEKIVYEQLFIQPQLIAVASAFPYAGSSIFTRIFAEYLNDLNIQVGVCESPVAENSWYDLIHGDSIIRNKELSYPWSSWHKQILEKESVQAGTELISNGVPYIVKHREDCIEQQWELMSTAHLVGFARSYPILFYDMSNGLNDERERIILKQANKVILVSGFDPLRVNREHKKYTDSLRIIQDKVIVIANRSSPELHKQHSLGLQEAYGVDHLYNLPMISELSEIYVNGEAFWQNKRLSDEMQNELESLFLKIAGEIISPEILKKIKPVKRTGFWNKLLRKRKKKDNLNEALQDEMDDEEQDNEE
ncbi:hypothetical protein [Paenibacillus tepidiphilus]|uniref:hypothetical protein n=1 Tax=Paenibacillus tepidiphilus TaxID=2608683 RepID=UPI001239470E|nr:hypothetical protein [Paenibacillus tepidiphilus]